CDVQTWVDVAVKTVNATKVILLLLVMTVVIAGAMPTHTPRAAPAICSACASAARLSGRPRGTHAMLKNEQRTRNTLAFMKPRITLITLGVDDLNRSLAFYRDGLGLATEGIVGTEFEHGAVVFFDLEGGCKLALWPRTSLAHDAGLPLEAR